MPRNKRKLKCSQCDKMFTCNSNLEQHMHVHTGDKLFKCDKCLKRFQQKWNLITHIQRVHDKIHPFVCKQCGKTFGYSSHFKKHAKKHLIDKLPVTSEMKKKMLKPHECTLCQASFDTQTKLKSHFMSHSEPLFVCDRCGRSFQSKNSVELHIKKFHETRDGEGLVCDQCGIVFNNKIGLEQHFRKGHMKGTKGRGMERVEKSERMNCQVCDKNVSRLYMSSHLNTHFKSKIYSCRYCQKPFLSYGNRKNHERIHTGEKPFQCEVCLKKHVQLGNLLAHRKRIHHLIDRPPHLINLRPVVKHNQENVRASKSNTKQRARRELVPLDYDGELKKVQSFVQNETCFKENCQTGNIDSMEQLLKITNVLVNKEFEASKVKVVKETVTDSEDDLPLVEIKKRISNEDNNSLVDFANITEPSPESSRCSSPIRIPESPVKRKWRVTNNTNNEEDEYIASIMEDVNEFKFKMSMLIFEKLKYSLNNILSETDIKKMEELKEKALEKQKNPLTIILKKMHLPDNEIMFSAKENRVWSCWECERQFKTHYLLNRHLVIHQPPETNPFQCKICGRACTQLENLREHMLLHTQQNKYYCDMCGAGYKHKTNFKRHIMGHYGLKGKERERRFKCTFCEKSFFTSFQKEEHERVHTRESPYLCRVCGMLFRTRCTFQRHKRTHTDASTYQCSVCHRKFSSKYVVDRHMVVHTGVRNFHCQCGKSFSQKSGLKKHSFYCASNTTPIEKTHVCPLCPKAFYIKHDMWRHFETHDLLKRFRCDLCSKLLKTQSTLRNHLARHANNECTKKQESTTTVMYKSNKDTSPLTTVINSSSNNNNNNNNGN